jgi:hypothetical protein
MAPLGSTQDVAHYEHASLDQFDRGAVEEVIVLFENAANRLGIQVARHTLTYDENNHVFFMACPNSIGAVLDDELGVVIRNYVPNTAAAITRFPECNVGDPFDDYDVQPDEDNELPLDVPTSNFHLVNFDGNNRGKAKAFRLRELPTTLSIRATSHQDISHLGATISFRCVKWDRHGDKHVFGGCEGYELSELSDDEVANLEVFLALGAFEDLKAGVLTPAHAPGPRPKGVPPVSGGVGEWLKSTGNTRQVDPDEEPEMTSDARKFVTNAVGRVRKPLGMTLLESKEPEMDQEEEPAKTVKEMNDSFAALMKGGRDNDSDTESSATSTDVASHLENIKPASTAKSIKGESTSGPAGNRVNLWRQPSNTTCAALPSVTQIHNESREDVDLPVNSGHLGTEENFLKYEKSYASVDKVGLRGNAINQVEWEKKNETNMSFSRKRLIVPTYESVQSSRAESVSTSVPDRRGADSKPDVSKTPMSRRETVFGGEESWARKVVRPGDPASRLVPVDEDTHDSGRPKALKVPPGFFPPLGSGGNEKQKSEEDVESLMWFDKDKPPIVEHVQSEGEEAPRLFRTMGQQAGRKKANGKSGNTKSTPSFGARLERPSPHPPSRPRREIEPAALCIPQFSTDTARVLLNEPEPDKRETFGRSIAGLLQLLPSDIQRVEVVIQFGLALIHDAEHLAENKALKCEDLQIQLDDLPQHHPSTSFRTILGRERKDGCYLLRLPAMLQGRQSSCSTLLDNWSGDDKYAISDRTVYEIIMNVPGGDEWKLVFDQIQHSPANVIITPITKDQSSLYVHYPARVWDARIQPKHPASALRKKPNARLRDNIAAFLKTVHTPAKQTATTIGPEPKEPPGFEALIPNGAFSITSVCAKRVWSQALRSGTWVVSQVWDLHIAMPSRERVMVHAEAEDVMQMRQGRLWWEAQLLCEGDEEGLQGTVSEVVEKLDSVGTCKKKKAKAEKTIAEKKKTAEPQYQPFW